MTDLLYTQATGFTAHSGRVLADIPALKAIEGYAETIQAAGYVEQWGYGDDDDRYVASDMVMGYQMEGANRYELPKFLVTHWDINSGVHIFCNDPGDFYALRLELSRNPQIAPHFLAEFCKIAMKAFRAFHGHDPYSTCSRCDLDK